MSGLTREEMVRTIEVLRERHPTQADAELIACFETALRAREVYESAAARLKEVLRRHRCTALSSGTGKS